MRGSSVIELMVTMVLLSLLMGAAYSSVIAQMRSHATQTLVSETMLAARSALSVLADQVELAGFGVPTANLPSTAPSLIRAEASRLSFWTNVTTTHTYLTAKARKNASLIKVVSAAGLATGSRVYITDTVDWYRGTVSSVDGLSNTVHVTPALSYDFGEGSFVTPIEQVTFELVGNALQRNGRLFIPNVSQLRFTYDATDLRAIRVISIALDVQTRAADVNRGKKITVSVATEVAPPNLAL